MQAGQNVERLLTVGELAAYLGVRPSWVYGRCAIGALPSLKVGRYLRFRLSEVVAQLELDGGR